MDISRPQSASGVADTICVMCSAGVEGRGTGCKTHRDVMCAGKRAMRGNSNKLKTVRQHMATT